MSSKEIWNKTLIAIEKKIGKQAIERWLKPIKLTGLKGSDAIIEVPNRFYKEWIEEHYYQLLSTTLSIFYESNLFIKFKISEELAATPLINRTKTKIDEKGRTSIRGCYINPKYSFDNFVVGECNKFANAASMAVAEDPGRKYNPLFVYGGVGLGKTHLMQAIGNFLFDTGRNIKILYMSTNQFMNEYIYAVRTGKITEFKKRNSDLDVLLVDDVQFIAGKESTQDELFHTFNMLYGLQKQIVFSSDRPPKEIASITERLRSRFGMGLIADIEPPDVETKMAILWKKSESEGIKLPEDVIIYLANKIKSNIRELESCLIRLGAHSSLSGRKITLDMAKNVLKDVIPNEEKIIDINTIQKIVCEHFGVKVQELKTKKRTKDIVIPRQVAMYLCRRIIDCSLSDIGKNFGGKDHSTVINACKQVALRSEKDDDFRRKITFLEHRLKS